MARPRRRSLGSLFVLLTLFLAGVSAYAAIGSSWIIAAAAGALCLWMGELAFRQLR